MINALTPAQRNLAIIDPDKTGNNNHGEAASSSASAFNKEDLIPDHNILSEHTINAMLKPHAFRGTGYMSYTSS